VRPGESIDQRPLSRQIAFRGSSRPIRQELVEESGQVVADK
jgi:hypothetical protein